MMKKTWIILLLVGVLLAPSVVADLTEEWAYDVAGFDYSLFQGHLDTWGRIRYRTEIMALCADVISNGNGPAGKPILEVFIASGGSHGEKVDNPDIFVDGSVVCLNGATGETIWHNYPCPEIFVQSKLELGDLDNDGKLELLISSYDAIQAWNAEDGSMLWKVTDYGHRLDKHNLIIRDPRDDTVYVYTSEMSGGPLSKRNALTGAVIAESSFGTSGPCFGGNAAADLDGDGTIEIIEDSGGTYCYDLDLNLIWRETTLMGSNTGAVPVIVDVNEDGYLDVVVIKASYSSAGIGVIDGKLSMQNSLLTGGSGTAVHMANKWSMTISGVGAHNAPKIYDIDNDGNLEAVMGWGPTVYGTVWDLGRWDIDARLSQMIGTHPAVIANVWGDSDLDIANGHYNTFYDQNYNAVTSGTLGSNPALVADLDGDGINEIVSDGSKIRNDATGTSRWSWGWNICYDTGATAQNPRQEVWSQLYNERRTGSELPSFEPLSIGDDDPPPPDVTCWACRDGVKYWAVFPPGTICGIGAASNYNLSVDPISCNEPPVVCWSCVDGSLVNTEVPYGTTCESFGLYSEPPTCFPNVPGFTLVVLLVGIALFLIVRKL